MGVNINRKPGINLKKLTRILTNNEWATTLQVLGPYHCQCGHGLVPANFVFSGPNAWVFPKGQGWTSLVGLWIRAAYRSQKKHARCILGMYVWALRPCASYVPFLAGWWAHCQWGENWLQICPLSLLTNLLHHLIISRKGWSPKPLLPLSVCGGGVLFVDGRVFHCSPFVGTPQEAKLEVLVRGVRLCINVGWPVWCLVGDNESALSYRARQPHSYEGGGRSETPKQTPP